MTSSILILAGVIFIPMGFIMLRFPPKTINYLYGYRTPASMKSQDRWDFAQAFSAKEMVKSGLFALLLFPIGFFLKQKIIDISISLALIATLCVYVIMRTEKAIKSGFDDK